jgi:hypothetical protein
VSSFGECGLPYGLRDALCTLQLLRSAFHRASSTVATLGLSGWLDLAQRGLAPRKKRQASLGALTPPRTASRPPAAFQIHSLTPPGRAAVPGKDGGYPAVLPTVPDVSNSLIRFVSIHTAGTVWITSRLTKPPGAELDCPSPVAENLLRRLVGSKSFPSVLPATRSPRLRLPSRGSLGPPFPTFTGTMLSYDCPRAPLRSLRLSLAPRYLVCSRPLCPATRFAGRGEAPCQRQGS